jgi:hypothetical protein
VTIDVTESERQVIILALADLALSRPGWDPMLAELAAQFAGLAMLEKFKRLNNDRVKALPADSYGGTYPL